VIFEGRDAAGKDGAIKRIVEHLSPRETRVVALGRPSDREQTEWYFQRHVSYLRTAGEFVLFNRSWYNRAGVERVMGFCTDAQYESFLEAVMPFERMLVDSGLQLFKYYRDINRWEQGRRLKARARSPLTHWKVSPIDQAAVRHWPDYTKARDVMLNRTDHRHGPWIIVRANDKKRARLNVIADLVQRIECPKKDRNITKLDRQIAFRYERRRRRALAR
jgi:polyphosphate kinase